MTSHNTPADISSHPLRLRRGGLPQPHPLPRTRAAPDAGQLGVVQGIALLPLVGTRVPKISPPQVAQAFETRLRLSCLMWSILR